MRRFVQTVTYRVGDLRQGLFAELVHAMRPYYATLPGLVSWKVMRERTGERRYTEVFTFESRDAYQTLQNDETFQKRSDDFLSRLGQAVDDVDSVEIVFHDVVLDTGDGEAAS